MQRRKFIKRTGAAGLMLFINSSLIAQNSDDGITTNFEHDFLQPPSSAYPQTFWFWMNGNVTKEGITKDLEAMREVGVGGVFNFDVGTGIPKGPVEYLS